MKFKLHQLILAAGLLLSLSLAALETKPKFDASVLTSLSYNITNKVLDLNQAYGASFTVRNIYSVAESKFSLRSDLLQESLKSSEGSFLVKVDRNYFREWAIVTNPVTADFLIGVGFALGFSQAMVATKIQDEQFKSYGTLEPLWGLMIDGQYNVKNKLVQNLFMDVMVRKMYANNYIKGERNELDFSIGVRF